MPLIEPEYNQHRERLHNALRRALIQKWKSYAPAQALNADLLVREVMMENSELVREAGEFLVHRSLYDGLCAWDDRRGQVENPEEEEEP